MVPLPPLTRRSSHPNFTLNTSTSNTPSPSSATGLLTHDYLIRKKDSPQSPTQYSPSTMTVMYSSSVWLRAFFGTGPSKAILRLAIVLVGVFFFWNLTVSGMNNKNGYQNFDNYIASLPSVVTPQLSLQSQKEFIKLIEKIEAIPLEEQTKILGSVDIMNFKSFSGLVRTFRKYFEPWLGLHVVGPFEDSVAFNGNRNGKTLSGQSSRVTGMNTPEISDAETTNSDANADMNTFPRTRTQDYFIRNNIPSILKQHDIPTTTYESTSKFLGEFERALFPWVSKPLFHDLLSVYTSFSGTGIVMSVGNRHWKYLLTTIPYLHKLGCTLPIEVFHIGENDLLAEYRETITKSYPHGVTFRDLTTAFDNSYLKLAGWAAKPAAIMASSFEQVLFVDADVVFLQNPQILFQDPTYTKTGTLFYLDREMFSGSSKEQDWLKEILPEPYSDKVLNSRFWKKTSMHQQESGVLLLHKRKHFVPLALTVELNGPVRDKITYKHVYGDKETFWIGFEMAGDTSYAFHPTVAGSIGPFDSGKIFHGLETYNDDGSVKPLDPKDEENNQKKLEKVEADKGKIVCGPQLLHFDIKGQPLWFNGWIFRSKFAKEFVLHQLEAWTREPGSWKLLGANMCCMRQEKSDQVYPLSDDVRERISWLHEEWARVDKAHPKKR